MNAAVRYYSRSGNTEAVAKAIASKCKVWAVSCDAENAKIEEPVDILFIGGGIGIAPVRSLIRYCLEHRSEFGHLDILYGARSKQDICFKEDCLENWPKEPDTSVYITTDVPSEDWDGHVGFVPSYIEEVGFHPEGKKVVLCGPPIMIKLGSASLLKLGFAREDVITTLELRMKCGIGKCGRCNIGSKFVCLDGPVFTLAELEELPDEK